MEPRSGYGREMATNEESRAVHLDDVAEIMGAGDIEESSVSAQAELPPFAQYNAVAAYEDAASAREAILSVERAGIDASKLAFLAIDSSEQTIEERTSELDHQEVSFVARGTAKGGSLGTVGGAAVGGALMLIPGVGPLVGAGVLGAALGGGFFGGVIGGIWGGFNRMGESAAWDETFHDIERGLALVGVHTDDRDEFERACRALKGDRVRFFDREGRALATGAGDPIEEST
jgi:hypothetical protein